MTQLLPILGLVLALSPILLDLGAHFAAQPWARYALVFVPLCLFALMRTQPRPARALDGYLWIALALCAEFAAIGGGTDRIGRLALPLAVIGACRAFGLAPLRHALVAVWLVPVPYALLTQLGPRVHELMVALTAPLLGALGLEAAIQNGHLAGPGGDLALNATNSGLTLAALFSGLAWYTSVRAGHGSLGAARAALLGGLAAFPAQVVLFGIGAVTCALSAPGVGSFFLQPIVWSVVALLGIGCFELFKSPRAPRAFPFREYALPDEIPGWEDEHGR